METTFEKIKEHLPCEDGWRKLLGYYNPTSLKEKITIEEIIKSNGIKDAVWALRCIENKEQSKKVYFFCADVAESVLHIFENKYENDNRPRKVIEAIRLFIDDEISISELKTAADAAATAAAAAYADDAINKWNEIKLILEKYLK